MGKEGSAEGGDGGSRVLTRLAVAWLALFLRRETTDTLSVGWMDHHAVKIGWSLQTDSLSGFVMTLRSFVVFLSKYSLEY